MSHPDQDNSAPMNLEFAFDRNEIDNSALNKNIEIQKCFILELAFFEVLLLPTCFGYYKNNWFGSEIRGSQLVGMCFQEAVINFILS